MKLSKFRRILLRNQYLIGSEYMGNQKEAVYCFVYLIILNREGNICVDRGHTQYLPCEFERRDINFDEFVTYSIGEKKKELEKIICNNQKCLEMIYSKDSFPYHLIAECIYELGENNDFRDSQEQEMYIKPSDNNDYLEMWNKVNRQVEVAVIQSNVMRSHNEKIANVLKSFNVTKEKIYAEFITILGIFTGCVFAVFGGFDGVKAILSVSKWNTSRILIFSSIILIMLILIMFALIQFIGVLIGRKMFSCNCDLTHGSHDKNCSCHNRYRILDITLNIALVILFIGLIISSDPHEHTVGSVLLLLQILWLLYRDRQHYDNYAK